ncbi:hypothetical protein CUU62_22865 [Pseudomonas sp. WP001]|nr:hypothetical protein CUU62_22865 [Pseudomonas sp. WP001]
MEWERAIPIYATIIPIFVQPNQMLLANSSVTHQLRQPDFIGRNTTNYFTPNLDIDNLIKTGEKFESLYFIFMIKDWSIIQKTLIDLINTLNIATDQPRPSMTMSELDRGRLIKLTTQNSIVHILLQLAIVIWHTVNVIDQILETVKHADECGKIRSWNRNFVSARPF